jgi:hypothetical protein
MSRFDLDKPSRQGRHIDFFIQAFLLLVLIVFLIPYIIRIARFLAVDGANLNEGQKNAAPIITALEKYKLDNGQYPNGIETLIYDHYLDIPRPHSATSYEYEYDVFPSQGNSQEYMLFFRARWSVDGWYCYYSKDGKWIKTYFTCWSDPRPEKPSSE